MIAGVSAGLGRYFDLTPTVFRLAFVVLALLGGAGILVYIAAALVMPKEGEDQSFAERALSQRRQHPGPARRPRPDRARDPVRALAGGHLAERRDSVAHRHRSGSSSSAVTERTAVAQARHRAGDDRGGAGRARRHHGRGRLLRLRRLAERRRRRPQLRAGRRRAGPRPVRVGIGSLDIDLSTSEDRRVDVTAKVGIGDLRVDRTAGCVRGRRRKRQGRLDLRARPRGQRAAMHA